jgi:hypothetical protein
VDEDESNDSSASDDGMLLQSRQSNNHEEEDDQEAKLTLTHPTSQGQITNSSVRTANMWTSADGSDDESNPASAAESFEDDGDGNIFDDDDEVPLARQEEVRGEPRLGTGLSRTKSGAIVVQTSHQTLNESSDDDIEEIEELYESIEEFDDDDDDDVAPPAAATTSAAGKSLFTRVEPKVDTVHSTLEDDAGDDYYEDDNFEAEDVDETNVTAYKNPGDISGSVVSDEVFSIGEESDIESF